MKEIILTQKKVAMVDDELFTELNEHSWHAEPHGKTWYAKRNCNGTTEYMHINIMGEKSIDHVDGNGLNNQKSNLRVSTQSQNIMNSSKRDNTKSKYKGVYYTNAYYNKNKYIRKKPWLVQIKANGQKITIGYFTTQEEGAEAYNIAAVKYFGEYARINYVEANNDSSKA